MNDLLKRLKALGLQINSAAILPEARRPEIFHENTLNGEWVERYGGRIYVINEMLPFGYSQGSIILQQTMDLGKLRLIQENIFQDKLKMEEIIFLDVETSSISSGTGTLIFLVGVCFFNQSGEMIVQMLLDDPINEFAFINYLDDLLKSYKLLVTYNGKTFDIPLLKTRFTLNKVHHPFDSIAHLDLLTISRRIWKLRLESRTLSAIEKEIMKFHRGQSEVPGWLVPQIYYDYLQTGEMTLLEGVFYHNKMDIISLSALFQHIITLVSNENMIFKSEGLDIFSIAYLLSPHIKNENAIDLFEKCIDKGIPEDKKIFVFKKIATYYKKNSIWDKATELWEHNASQGDFVSCVELAKYYEHRVRDNKKAIFWVEQAENSCNTIHTSANLDNLLIRRSRLLRKIQDES